MDKQLREIAARTLGNREHQMEEEARGTADRRRELAFNLWWNWHPQVLELFRELDPAGWKETNHNPIALLSRLSPDQLLERVTFLSLENRVSFHYRRLQEYLASERTWCSAQAGALRMTPIAYFPAASRQGRGAA